MLEVQERKRKRKKGEEVDLPEKMKVAGVETSKKTTGPSTTKMAKPPTSSARECEKNANFFLKERENWRNKWAGLALKGAVGVDTCVQP